MKAALKITRWIFFGFIITLLAGATMLKLKPYQVGESDNKFYFPVRQVSSLDKIKHEEIFLKSQSGQQLHTVLFAPASDVNVKNVAVFLLHGAGGNISRYSSFAETLTNAGFLVYTLDWQGFGKSEGKPTHLNVYQDTELAFQHFLNLPQVKGKKVIVYGLSLGGQLAIKLTKDYQSKVDGLVTEGSAASFYSLAADNSPAFMRPLLWLIVKGPYNAQEDIREINVTPKLIIQSADDKNVAFARGQELFENAVGPKEFWPIKGEHLAGLKLNQAFYLQKLENLVRAKAMVANK